MLPGEVGVYVQLYTGRKVQGCCQGRGEHTLVEKFEDIFGGAVSTVIFLEKGRLFSKVIQI